MIIIGEKLNGSIPVVAEAIAKRDEAFLRERARMQAAGGAAYLDVCASVDVEIEAETLSWMVDLVQDEVDTPICLDSPNPDALLAVLPRCKKPGVINSVSLEGTKIDRIFPAIADTSWNCIALLCDGHGIPDSVEKRLAVLDGILKRADEFHIAHARLFIDPMVVTLSTDEAALTSFAACALEIKRRYPAVHVTSGLSNISFGLPARKYMNEAFMMLAMAAGMDSAICDPTNRDLLGLIYAADALLQNDEYCIEYIGAYRRGLFGKPKNA